MSKIKKPKNVEIALFKAWLKDEKERLNSFYGSHSREPFFRGSKSALDDCKWAINRIIKSGKVH